MKSFRFAPLAALVGLALPISPAYATFHFWDIVEIYSNHDGSVQFVEMFNFSNNEHLMANHQLRSNSNTFTIPANLSTTATANRRLLFATSGFGALAGGVTPNYIIPSNFFSISGDTLNFANVDTKSFTSIPTDGVLSLNYPGGSSATNSPTNFAGMAGSVDLPSLPMTTGDYNGDLTVDAADYTVWRDTLGQNVEPGSGADGEPDGTIDVADYNFWKQRFGSVVSGSAAAVSVPEPSVFSLVFCGFLGVIAGAARARLGGGKL